MTSSRAGRWPLLPIAPVIVAVVGIAVAAIIASVGARQLQRTSDAAAALRSKALAATLAARIRSAPVEQRGGLLARAARRSGASFLLVDQAGTMLVDQPLGPGPPPGHAHAGRGRGRDGAADGTRALRGQLGEPSHGAPVGDGLRPSAFAGGRYHRHDERRGGADLAAAGRGGGGVAGVHQGGARRRDLCAAAHRRDGPRRRRRQRRGGRISPDGRAYAQMEVDVAPSEGL